jgi:TolA-binding protein
MVFAPQKVGLRMLQVLRIPNPEELIAPPQSPQATPDEKMKGMLGMMKQRTENIKVTGAVAVQLTQALLNMVEASGGMQNNQMALLTMAQLEHAVKQMMQDAGNAGTGLDGVAQQPGDQPPPGLPSPPQAGGAGDVPGGQSGGPDPAGAGGGLV